MGHEFLEVLINPLLILIALVGVYAEIKMRGRSTIFGVIVVGLLAATAGSIFLRNPFAKASFFQAAIPIGIAYAFVARFVLTKTKLLD